MRTSPRVSPATILAALALFFALGGSALAVGGRVLGSQARKAAQPRCTSGAVRGIAVVTGTPTRPLGAIPATFTSDGRLFRSEFNCAGRRVEVRRIGAGVFEVRFPGNAVPRAVATALGSCSGPVTLDVLAPGLFRVYTRGCATGGNVLQQVDLGFVLVAV